MNDKIKLSIYKSETPLKPSEFYTYSIVVNNSSSLDNDKFSLTACINIAARHLQSIEQKNVYTDINQKKIISNEPIAEANYIIPEGIIKIDNITYNCQLIAEDKKLLDLIQYKDFYKKYVLNEIKNSLNDKYIGYCKKYIAQKNKNRFEIDISSNFLENFDENKNIISNFNTVEDERVKLNRKYNLLVFDIDASGYVYLKLDSTTNFISKYTIMDYIANGDTDKIINAKAEYLRENLSTKQTGTIKSISAKTISEPLNEEWCSGSLKEYYLNRYPYRSNVHKRINSYPDATPIVYMQRNGKFAKPSPYIPQDLRIILTTENMKLLHGQFYKKCSLYVHRTMQQRLCLNHEFLKDVGKTSSGLKFYKDNILSEAIDAEEIGYKAEHFTKPVLKGKSAATGHRYTTFSKKDIIAKGFYSLPPQIMAENKECINVGVLILDKNIAELKPMTINFFSYIYKRISNIHNGNIGNFSYWDKSGKLRNIEFTIPKNKDKKYLIEQYDYESDSIIAKNKLKKDFAGKADFILGIINEKFNDGEYYNNIKEKLAELEIPSQFITTTNVKILADAYLQWLANVKLANVNYPNYSDKKEVLQFTEMKYNQKADSICNNILLSIWAKLGGIPFTIDKLPGDTDMFMGIDIGMQEKGIHYPSVSTAFSDSGEPLTVYTHQRTAQRGEKIPLEHLEKICNSHLEHYYNLHNCYPKRIVIHRDGFSNEDLEWYKQYFTNKNIKLNIVEVIKRADFRLADLNAKKWNPLPGTHIINGDTCFLINSYRTFNAPRILKIHKVWGDLPIKILAQQVFILAQINYGAMNDIRLPVTTFYADKCCKKSFMIPPNKITNMLYCL